MMKRSSFALHCLESLRLPAWAGASVIDKEPRQIEQPRHPGDYGDHMQSFDPRIHYSSPRFADQIHQPLDMRDWRLGQNAVT